VKSDDFKKKDVFKLLDNEEIIPSFLLIYLVFLGLFNIHEFL